MGKQRTGAQGRRRHAQMADGTQIFEDDQETLIAEPDRSRPERMLANPRNGAGQSAIQIIQQTKAPRRANAGERGAKSAALACVLKLNSRMPGLVRPADARQVDLPERRAAAQSIDCRLFRSSEASGPRFLVSSDLGAEHAVRALPISGPDSKARQSADWDRPVLDTSNAARCCCSQAGGGGGAEIDCTQEKNPAGALSHRSVRNLMDYSPESRRTTRSRAQEPRSTRPP